MRLFRFIHEPDIPWVFHCKFFSIEILKAPGRGRELEPQLVGIQRLAVHSHKPVVLVAAVLPVPQQWVPDVGEVRPYLVSASGEQVNFHKAAVGEFPEHPVFRPDSAVGGSLAVGDEHAVLVRQLFEVGGEGGGAASSKPLFMAS